MMKRAGIFVCMSVLLISIASVFYFGPDRIMRKLQGSTTIFTLDRSAGETTFPDIDTKNLSVAQRKIVELSKQEFASKPRGTKYSEGTQESWCADFVSWVMKEADVPLKNPNSGSWRIPGTYTLLDYYKSTARFRDVSSGYVPKAGDVAIYRASPVFGDHTNIVLKNEDGVLTTIGGNENGMLRVYVNAQKNYGGLLGYGVLQ